MVLDALVLAAWVSPIYYFSSLVGGEIARRIRRRKLGRRGRVEKVIFQIPTVGNAETTNRAFRAVKSYGFPVETWVVIEEGDDPSRYEADRVVVVPRGFQCECLYKARALEYARRLRKEMVERGELSPNYVLLQGDDDSIPSREFVEECLSVDADIVIGTITPRPVTVLGTLIDYERSVACGTQCNLFTNISSPVWGHGEAMCISSRVDLSVSYDVSDIGRSGQKLISSEDLFYLHKAVHKGFRRVYNSTAKVYITPPLSLRDAFKQRRRWMWGNLRIVLYGLLPLSSRLRILAAWILGLYTYTVSTLGIFLYHLGIVKFPDYLYPLLWATLVMWLLARGVSIGRAMGWKHGVLGTVASHITVTLNFVLHVAALLKGDPKKFEVIKKA
ncbi:glycosyltransferase family 2 protein [Pyrobaculum sp.]|uniref:glycosyltransferase family 2 protein n=1 Tax=Pyrobaculum sp. TaxID=2004705 RepID=UPI003D0F9267